MKDKLILLISPESWGTNFVSKHHYANYLSKQNKVYFLNQVTGFKFNLFGKLTITKEKINENLTIISYKNLIPKLNNLPNFIQRIVYKQQAKQLKKNLGEIDLVWSFDPNRYFDQSVWQSKKNIYHTVDFHYTSKTEKEICKTSDVIIGVTPLVIKSISNYSSNINRVGHGADIDGFKIDKSIKVPGNNKTKACYTGNFHKQIDYTVLFELAIQNKDLDLILIGPTIDSNLNLSLEHQIDHAIYNKLSNLDNVFFIGSVPSNMLMSYLTQCDINLVLFKKENEITHCSPHKLMAYFYSGNLTISNYIDEHKLTDSDIILMEQEIEKIPKLIKKVIKNLGEYNNSELSEKRKRYAIDNSYDNKIQHISNLINS